MSSNGVAQPGEAAPRPAGHRPRGRLRVYLGAAPGVGKTFAMLSEGRRRAERGTDVVIALVESHGRELTKRAMDGLEVVPRREVSYRGATLTEMDTPAVLARAPAVALVDELAHTNAPGLEHPKRWQDVQDLLAAGIDVITTVNIQHLESLNDVVEKITGVRQRETVPDAVVRAAEQIELVDQTPEALRRRMAHGNIYAPEKVDAALAHYFRVGNLTALRELALLWLADRVEEGLQQYRVEHGIEATWETRERVVVALTGGPEGETLLRRAARIAARAGGDLLAVHIARADGLPGSSSARLAVQQALAETLGGSYTVIADDDVPRALLAFAAAENATQIVLGASRRGWLTRALSGLGTAATVVRHSGDIDVHIVPHEHAAGGRLLPVRPDYRGLPRRRQAAGAGLALLGLPLLTAALSGAGDTLNLPSLVLLYLAGVVAVALVGGLYPALLGAIGASLLLNYYFTPPVHTLTVAERNNLLALAVFLAVAVAVAVVVDLAARRTREAARAGTEADVLSALSRGVLQSRTPLQALLDQARQTFGARSVALEKRTEQGWQVVLTAAGPAGRDPRPPPTDGAAQAGAADGTGDPQDLTTEPVGQDARLRLSGRPMRAGDRRLLAAFAAQAAVALTADRLSSEAARARHLAEGNRIRTALLAAVSHDLRSPLAAIKASISSLRSSAHGLTPQDVAELYATIEESADRLQTLVSNLLDMSRLTTGALTPLLTPVALDDVVDVALRTIAEDAPGETRRISRRVQVQIPPDLRPAVADPGLLERAVANLVENALTHTPPGTAVTVSGSEHRDRVELRVVDRGPGLSEEAKIRCFEPFQRLGDVPQGTGVGLGLAVASGFVTAMAGTITAEDTPGGGLTMTISLPAPLATDGSAGASPLPPLPQLPTRPGPRP